MTHVRNGTNAPSSIFFSRFPSSLRSSTLVCLPCVLKKNCLLTKKLIRITRIPLGRDNWICPTMQLDWATERLWHNSLLCLNKLNLSNECQCATWHLRQLRTQANWRQAIIEWLLSLDINNLSSKWKYSIIATLILWKWAWMGLILSCRIKFRVSINRLLQSSRASIQAKRRWMSLKEHENQRV